MDNPFEDIKREYVNRYSETHGILLANDYDSFVQKILSAIMTALNEDYEILRNLDREMRLAIEKGKTPDEWLKQKADILVTLFFLTLDECPQLKHEFSHHLYNALRA